MINPKKIFINYCLPIIAVIFLAGLAYAADWTSPTELPPGGNVAPPLTAGAGLQVTAGTLVAQGLAGGASLETYYNTILATINGNVGIGTTNPASKLQVGGVAKADDFCLNGDPAKCLSTVSGSETNSGVSGGGDCVCEFRCGGDGLMNVDMKCATDSAFRVVQIWGGRQAMCTKDFPVNYFPCSMTEGGISVAPTSTSSGGIQLFFSSGTFTVPAGVTSVTIELWGGGGGGGGGGGAVGALIPSSKFVGPHIGGGGGGGGAGGHKLPTNVSVVSGSVYPVAVGTGGSGGAGGATINWMADSCGRNGASGGNGGASAVVGLVSVQGGGGGQGGHPECYYTDTGLIGGRDGGNGGAAGNENSLAGIAGNKWADGGAGGSGIFGQGGSGRSGGTGTVINTEDGSIGTTGTPGDKGSDGFVIITW